MLTKDIMGRTSHTLKKAVKVFGKTFEAGTEVKFRPLQVMRLQGEMQIGDVVIHWRRTGCSLSENFTSKEVNREGVTKLVAALDPPAEEWQTAQYAGPAPSPWQIGALT